MIEVIHQNVTAILAVLAALIGIGLVIKLAWTRSGRDTNIVNQKGATAEGDNIGRDKITREDRRR